MKSRGGEGGGGNASGPVSAHTIYLLSGEGDLALEGGSDGGSLDPSPSAYTMVLRPRHVYQTINPHRRLVILTVAFSVTRSLQLNGKNVFCCTPGCRIVPLGGHSGQ